MNAFLRNIFSAAPHHPSNKAVIRWWEQRRLFYNMIMLVAGSFTMLLAVLLHEIPVSNLMNTLPPVLVFAFSANLFYTLGWLIEIACRKYLSNKELVQKSGPVLFFAGTSLSVFFTLAIDIAIVVAFFFDN